MVYMFARGWETDGNYAEGEVDRWPWDQPWYKEKMGLTSELHRPIEDWIRPYYTDVITVNPKQYPLLDWVSGSFVSQRVKDLIEQVEPGLHQFIPVELHYGDEIHQYYMLFYGRSENLYDLGKSDVEWVEQDFGIPEVGILKQWRLKQKALLAFPKESVTGKHLWQNAGHDYGPYLTFMSDELHDLFVENGISGIRYEKQIVV